MMWLNNLITQSDTLLFYWINYTVICVPLVYLMVMSLPFKMRYRQFWPWLTLYLFAITIVFFGIFIVAGAVIILSIFPPKLRPKIPYSTAGYPQYQRSPSYSISLYGEGAGYKMVTEPYQGKAERKEMLVKMNQTSSGKMNKINELVLEDTTDEMRLYAQSIIEKQQETLMHLTTKFTKALARTKNSVDAAVFKKVIAHVLWEQIYKQLTIHLNIDIALTKIKNLALESFEVLTNDAELPILLTKVALKESNLEEAKFWLLKAQENEAPDFKIISYIAELAFYCKDYESIKELFKDKFIIGVQPQISFWNNNND